MRVVVLMLVVILCSLLAGCASMGRERAAAFAPVEMRLNPTFTIVTDEGSLRADVELRDMFGDPTKGAGTVILELYLYEAAGVDILGRRLVPPARYDLSTADAQRQYWQQVVRTYRFDLPWSGLDRRQRYVLIATYEPRPSEQSATTQPATQPTTRPGSEPGGSRLFDRMVLTPRPAT